MREEQTLMVDQSSFLKSIEQSEYYTFTILTFQKFSIQNGNLDVFWEDAEDIAWI